MSDEAGRAASRALSDDALVELLSRLLRERPADGGGVDELLPEGLEREAALAELEVARLIRRRDAGAVPLPPAESVGGALLEALDDQVRSADRMRSLLLHLPLLSRHWEDGSRRQVRGIEGEVIVGAMDATRYWVRLLAEDPPHDAGSSFPSFESMRSFLTPVLEHFAALVASGELAEVPRLPFRFLLNSRELDDADYRAMLDQLVAGGAEVRVLPEVPLFLYVDRGRLAGIPMTRDSVAPGGGIFFENAATVDSFSVLFESWWARASPYPLPDEGWRSVLELLAHGRSDKQIAATLGIGLRTVHRRIADAMTHCGVATRFELGMEWARRQQAQSGEG